MGKGFVSTAWPHCWDRVVGAVSEGEVQRAGRIRVVDKIQDASYT